MYVYGTNTRSDYGIINAVKSVFSWTNSFSRFLLITVETRFHDDSLRLTFISKMLEEPPLPYPYSTHYTAPLVHLRCANEYFSKSKWILLLSQTCWHRLRRYRWGISARHARSTGVMYRDVTGSGHFGFLFSFFFPCSERRSHLRDLAAVKGDCREITTVFAHHKRVWAE